MARSGVASPGCPIAAEAAPTREAWFDRWRQVSGGVAFGRGCGCNAGMNLPVRLLAVVVCVLALAACQHGAPRNPMATWVASPNFDARRAQVIVLHFTAQESAGLCLQTLRMRSRGGRGSSPYV